MTMAKVETRSDRQRHVRALFLFVAFRGRLMRIFLGLLSALLLIVVVAAGGAVFAIHHFSQGLPEYSQLADYQPPTVTRVHAGDGRVLAEFATEHRVFVPIGAMPKRVIHAFLSAEDQTFYTHRGVDFGAVMRAIVVNVENVATGRRMLGASTITQQVAKNFLLTNEVSYERKIKEAILAFRIEQALHQGPHPRALPERDLSRLRHLRRRGGGARTISTSRWTS